MAAKKSRARQFGGGGIDIGAILNAVQGDTNVDNVPNIKDPTTDKPYDWSGKDIPTSNIKTKMLTKQDMSDIGSGKLFRGKGPSGTELAAKGNIENILAEEASKRAIRTKVAEEKALTEPLIDRHKLLLQVENDAELQKLLKTNPEHLEQAKKISAINVLTARGIVPTQENIDKFNNTLSETQIAEELETSRANTLKGSLSQENTKRALEQESATRGTDLQTEIAKSKFGLGEIQGAQELQPLGIQTKRRMLQLAPTAEETKIMRERMLELSPGQSIYDINRPRVPLATAPDKFQQYQDLLNPQNKILPKVPQGPNLGPLNYQTQANPNDQYETIIIDGQVVRRKKPTF